ncbi:MAG: ion channel [Planctomycetota bacterium]
MNEVKAGLRGSSRLLASAYVRRRYAILFYSLLLTLVVAPLLKALGLNVNVIAFFMAVNLLAAVVPLGAGYRRRVLLGIVVVAWAGETVAACRGQHGFAEVSLGAWTVVAVLAATGTMRFALRASAVTSEHLYAALSAYLLAGIFFGVFYWILERIWPGSLLIANPSGAGDFRVVHGMYFSFVTLSAVGYGDILPRSDLARGCAMLQAVGGQFYIAVMIARLVSLYSGRGRHRVRDVRTPAPRRDMDT